MTGCGYDENDDWWWAELGFHVETTMARPIEFGPEGASASGFLARCPDGECVRQTRYRTWFGGLFESVILDGTLDTFDPVAGRFVANVTMKQEDTQYNLETGDLVVQADFSWPSEYVPVVEGALGAHWHLRSTERFYGESDFAQNLELSQTGYAIQGRLCDTDFVCQESDLTGKLADPSISLFWTDPEGATVEVHGSLDHTGKHFEGTALKHGDNDGYWNIEGDEVN
jgi:hypothetical protein